MIKNKPLKKELFTLPLRVSYSNKALLSFPYEQYNLTPIEIVDIQNNRNQLKINSYKRAGIYLWLAPNEKMYVGRSINLYARVRSYFYRISKYKGVSLIRNYLNKHGFNSVRLVLFILPKKYTFNELVRASFFRFF